MLPPNLITNKTAKLPGDLKLPPLKKKVKLPIVPSKLEQLFINLCQQFLTIQPEFDKPFHAIRKWRFDFSWPDRMVAVEIDGGNKMGGAHNRRMGRNRDNEKQNAAIALNWVVLRFTEDDLKNRPVQIMEEIAKILEQRYGIGIDIPF